MSRFNRSDRSAIAIAVAAEGPTGPSFTAALLGFLSTTVATTALLILLGSL